MKIKLLSLFIGLALLAAFHEAIAQTAQFFRLVGPTAVKIKAFRADGTLVWSGATPGATYTVQSSATLAGGGSWGNYNQIVAGGSVSTNAIFTVPPPAGMVLIPAGPFTIGDQLDGESDAHPTNVTVSAFYMDVNLVSYNLWAGVYAYAASHGYTFDYAGAGVAGNHPVQTVNWYDVVKWSNARSMQAGLTPVYYTDAALTQVYTNGDNDSVYPNWSANGYRLPTEAEWEKAARGGLSGQRFPWGNTISESQANYIAWFLGGHLSYDLGPYSGYNTNFDAGSYPYTSPVGFFPANGYGLTDMAGNVFEWCWDWFGTPYGQPTTNNPTGPGPGPASTSRVLRGGVWEEPADYSRCAYRSGHAPFTALGLIGFRCVRGH